MNEYCSCEVPNINPVSDICEHCKRQADPARFVWQGGQRYYNPPAPPTLGVSVKQGINAEEKLG
jgi:hypothetical protein